MTTCFLAKRRAVLAAGPLLLAARPAVASPQDALRQQWFRFRDQFMRPEGRVVDTGNGGISHSEGQGWAMLCAVRADDPISFQRLHGWSMRVLKRPQDELFSWRYAPQAATPVADANNATDGDLFIAWALLEAGARWGDAGHAAQGAALARDILRRLVRMVGGHLVLMPGLRGFEHQAHVVLNPSYYAFPAIRALAAAVPDPAWLRLAADGLALMRRARFGRWGLPPDWLKLAREHGRLRPASGWPPRFSYDAVRVPLYFAWVGLTEEPALTAAARFWSDRTHRHLPAWADLTNDVVSPYPASSGISAVAQLIRVLRSSSAIWACMQQEDDAGPDYYSASLSLLVALAARDSGLC
ncbi:MAG TPA: glycosyl hydrolase family 8 [Roseococcus sp.]|jgi:endoglucanase|nr:glycosyl hydrolase family 8 [Roseococcus sp.]